MTKLNETTTAAAVCPITGGKDNNTAMKKSSFETMCKANIEAIHRGKNGRFVHPHCQVCLGKTWPPGLTITDETPVKKPVKPKKPKKPVKEKDPEMCQMCGKTTSLEVKNDVLGCSTCNSLIQVCKLSPDRVVKSFRMFHKLEEWLIPSEAARFLAEHKIDVSDMTPQELYDKMLETHKLEDLLTEDQKKAIAEPFLVAPKEALKDLQEHHKRDSDALARATRALGVIKAKADFLYLLLKSAVAGTVNFRTSDRVDTVLGIFDDV